MADEKKDEKKVLKTAAPKATAPKAETPTPKAETPTPKAETPTPKAETPTPKSPQKFPLATIVSMVGASKAVGKWAHMNYATDRKTGREWIQVLVLQTVLSQTEADKMIQKFKF